MAAGVSCRAQYSPPPRMTAGSGHGFSARRGREQAAAKYPRHSCLQRAAGARRQGRRDLEITGGSHTAGAISSITMPAVVRGWFEVGRRRRCRSCPRRLHDSTGRIRSGWGSGLRVRRHYPSPSGPFGSLRNVLYSSVAAPHAASTRDRSGPVRALDMLVFACC